jgi:hypothetical protein
VPESPTLQARLAPYESLRLNIHETYVRYPSPQMIAAVARGNSPLPDDPELRAIVVRLADRYLGEKKIFRRTGQLDQNDDADLNLKMKLSDILKPEQIAALKNGKAEEKSAVLESIPPAENGPILPGL